MSLRFELQKAAGSARLGLLTTHHGVIETPVFMPVGTAATVKAVSQDILEELGVQILLGNTYHLYLRPGVDQIRKLGGLHRFMSWERAILTDSGGFQVFSLSELRKVTEEGVTFRSHLDGSSHFFTPESAMAVQIGLGADIIMAFDECTEYPADPERVRSSMEMTLRWAERSKRYFEEHKHEVPWGDGQSSVVGGQEHQIPRFARNDKDEGNVRNDKVEGDARHDNDKDEGDAREDNREGDARNGKVEGTARDDGRKEIESNAEVRSAGQVRAPFDKLRAGSAPTQARAAEAAGATQSLFGIVQGGMDLQLRKESAERTVEIGFPGYAIGGLSVGEPRHVTREVVEATLEYLPKDQPRYLMGVGTPEEIAEYAGLGVDMMDCVLPTRAARHGLLFTSEGKISIKQARYAGDEGALDPECSCRVCGRYSRAYLRHLYASNELLAQVLNTIHNLSFYLDTMRRVRDAISLGDRARVHSGVRSARRS